MDVISDTEGVICYEYHQTSWFNRNSELSLETAGGVPTTITDASPGRVRLHNLSTPKPALKETTEFVIF